jgi:hypothetical protein
MIVKIDKRILVGSLCAMAALAIVAFKYSPQAPTREIRSLTKPEPRAVIQDYSATRPTEKAMLTDHLAVDWKKEFQTSTDYFPLIAKAAKAALEGDGRAAYNVSTTWLYCTVFTQQYGTVEHPEEKFNDDMNTQYVFEPPEWIEKKRKKFQACSGFFKLNDPHGHDVFADLPNREGGYRSVKFWMGLAYQNNDPVAQTEHAGLAVGRMSPSSDQIQVAQADLNHAIASGDPDALFNAGMVITMTGLYVDRIEGFALSLAACNLGRDCTAENSSGSDLPFGDCVVSGTCAPGSVFSDWITKQIGAEGYTQAYARAQQIQEALAQGNTSALQQFAKLKD